MATYTTSLTDGESLDTLYGGWSQVTVKNASSATGNVTVLGRGYNPTLGNIAGASSKVNIYPGESLTITSLFSVNVLIEVESGGLCGITADNI
jgi:hypothetical protein